MCEEISQRMNTLGYKCAPNQARQCFPRMEKKCGELQGNHINKWSFFVEFQNIYTPRLYNSDLFLSHTW